MRIFCGVCDRDITDEQAYNCDRCGQIICGPCCSGEGFNLICKECEEAEG